MTTTRKIIRCCRQTAILLVALVCLNVLPVSSIYAQSVTNFTWIGTGGDRLWSNPDNWLREGDPSPESPYGVWHMVVFDNTAADDLRVVEVNLSVEVCRLYVNCTTGNTGYVFNSVNDGDITFRNTGSGAMREKLRDSEDTVFDTVFNIDLAFPTSSSHLRTHGHGEVVINNPVSSGVQLRGTGGGIRFRSTTPPMQFYESTKVILDVPAGQTIVYSDNIGHGLSSGYQIVKDGEGVGIITGTKDYQGITRVIAGRLEVNGQAIDTVFSVEAGGTLAGSGTVAATTIEAHGILGAGSVSEMGTLTLNGLTLNDEGIIRLRVDAPGDPHDTLQVNADLVLDGLLEIVDTSEVAPGAYPLIAYTGTLTDNGLQSNIEHPRFKFEINTDTPGVVKLECGPDRGTIVIIR